MVRPLEKNVLAELFAVFSLSRGDLVGGLSHTWGKRLLQLLGLVLVLEDEGVEVTVAADLELDLLSRGLLDAGSCLCAIQNQSF